MTGVHFFKGEQLSWYACFLEGRNIYHKGKPPRLKCAIFSQRTTSTWLLPIFLKEETLTMGLKENPCENNCFYRSAGPYRTFTQNKFCYWRKYMHLVLVNHFDLSQPRNSMIRLADSRDATIAVYRGHTATTEQQKSTGATSFLYESTHMKKTTKMAELLP